MLKNDCQSFFGPRRPQVNSKWPHHEEVKLLKFKPYHAVLLVLFLLVTVGCSKPEEAKPGEATKQADKAHGHAHPENQGPHEGVVAKLAGGAGFVELKLHDDKGDLELWIATDKKITKPIDLPLDAVIKVTFPERDGKVVELRARNTKHNEDENGTPNIREGATNYFIFPGETGAAADWLEGKTFSAKVVVGFERGGEALASEPLTLEPHHHEH